MSREAVVKVRVVDGARSEEWRAERIAINRLRVPYCDECLTIRPNGEWISVELVGEIDRFCSWECLLIDVAGICLDTEDDHPQIKVKRPKAKR